LVDVGGCCTGVASTVVDVTGEAPRILRDGGVSSDAVFETLADNEVLA
jgi:tRNA A37 threonylcarbamoyladenosine synthetase subunit TsaC/SUA5/YrdC